MSEITFANPMFLWALLIVPFLMYWYIFRVKKTFALMDFSNSEFLPKLRKTLKQRLYPILYVLRILTIICIIIALARPQSTLEESKHNIEGIDIVMAIDVSGSMLAEDFKPNRLEAAKKVAQDFIEGRENDRIAITAFSGEAYTQCPLTIDKTVLSAQIKELRSGVIEDGTAIGDGLATSLNRIKDSKTKSKTIILLTDGVHNMGAIDPLTAAEMAKLYKTRVYTIGIGRHGTAPYPFSTPFGIQYQNIEVQLDEELLKNIAQTTGGKYFRATNQNKLKEIFKEIDKLEKTEIEVITFEHYSEEYFPLLWLALMFLILEVLLRMFIFKILP